MLYRPYHLATYIYILIPFSMIPEYVHPVLHRPISALLERLLASSDEPPLQKVIPFPDHPVHNVDNCPPPTLTSWTFTVSNVATKTRNLSVKSRTHVMATLNVTPDSFSDGSAHDKIPTALKYALSTAEAGASIVDVGGYSTRPGAAYVSVDDEIARVVPAIKALRRESLRTSASSSESHEKQSMPISVDTFRPEVAQAAILAGANCINDVYAFTGPDSYANPTSHNERDRHFQEMKAVARKYAVPVILMHSRGDAGQNKNYEAYNYAQDGSVVEGVRIELGAKVDAIVKGKGGVRRWLVIADPGVGFSKTVDGNLEVLKRASTIVAAQTVGPGMLIALWENLTKPFFVIANGRYRNALEGYPLLIGASRKSFLGNILARSTGKDTEPNERGWATAAAVACAVQQGALVVRVHDVKEMTEVVRVAEALWS